MIAALALAAASIPCGLPAGWDQVARRPARYVVFGEIHGTREAPAIVGQTVCALARKRQRVLLAVELSVAGDAALQTAWNGPPESFAASVMRTMPDWRIHFGATSQAMLEMLVMLQAERARGRAIDVVAFNGDRDAAQHERFAGLPGQGPNEASKAENIRLAAERGAYDKVVVLVGNTHARKDESASGGVRFDWMARRLAAPQQVVALNMAWSGGTAWNCETKAGAGAAGGPITRDMLDCGSHAMGRGAAMEGPRRIGLGGMPGARGADTAYDGWYWLGEVTASPPALRDEP